MRVRHASLLSALVPGWRCKSIRGKSSHSFQARADACSLWAAKIASSAKTRLVGPPPDETGRGLKIVKFGLQGGLEVDVAEGLPS